MNDDLPESWKTCRLGDICTPPQYGWTTSANPNRSSLKLLRTSDISNGLVNWSGVPGCEEDPENPKQFLLSPGDIVISRAGSTGLSYLIGNDCPRAIFASYLIRFRPLPPNEGRYIALFLKSPQYWEQVSEKVTGISIPNVNASKLKEIVVPLAPPDEQNLIATTVEGSLSQISTLQKRLLRAQTILKRFRQAVLAAACSGRLTEDWRYKRFSAEETNSELPSGWQWKTVEELIPPGGMFDGPFGSNLKTSDYTDSGVRVIRLENIGHLRFIPEKQAYISQPKYKTLTKHTVGEDDIIFASFIEEAIRVCLLPKLPTLAIAKADCFCLRPLSDIDRSYLVLQLASPESYEKLAENIHGATRPRINISQLRKLQVRVCSPDEQREIVRRVRALFALADQIEARCTQARAHTDSLTQSILSKAFRGELFIKAPATSR